MVKSGLGAMYTTRLTVWVMLPLVALIVMKYAPVAAEPVEIAAVALAVLPAPNSIELGIDTVGPAGELVALREIVPAN